MGAKAYPWREARRGCLRPNETLAAVPNGQGGEPWRGVTIEPNRLPTARNGTRWRGAMGRYIDGLRHAPSGRHGGCTWKGIPNVGDRRGGATEECGEEDLVSHVPLETTRADCREGTTSPCPVRLSGTSRLYVGEHASPLPMLHVSAPYRVPSGWRLMSLSPGTLQSTVPTARKRTAAIPCIAASRAIIGGESLPAVGHLEARPLATARQSAEPLHAIPANPHGAYHRRRDALGVRRPGRLAQAQRKD